MSFIQHTHFEKKEHQRLTQQQKKMDKQQTGAVLRNYRRGVIPYGCVVSYASYGITAANYSGMTHINTQTHFR